MKYYNFKTENCIVQSLYFRKLYIGLVYSKEKQTDTADVNIAPWWKYWLENLDKMAKVETFYNKTKGVVQVVDECCSN